MDIFIFFAFFIKNVKNSVFGSAECSHISAGQEGVHFEKCTDGDLGLDGFLEDFISKILLDVGF